MPGVFGRLVGAERVPKVSRALAYEQEPFQAGRLGACSDALLVLLAPFVQAEMAQAMCPETHSCDLAGRVRSWIEPLPALSRWRGREPPPLAAWAPRPLSAAPVCLSGLLHRTWSMWKRSQAALRWAGQRMALSMCSHLAQCLPG